MSELGLVEIPIIEQSAARARIAALLNKTVFVSLLALIVCSLIPYATAEPWWKAAVVCSVFAICIIAILECMITGESRIGGNRGVLFSMLALCVLATIQTINIRTGSPDPAVAALKPWNAISADPYETLFFVLQLLALTACLALLYRYVRTERRINVLIHVIIGVAVVSALFGILRQTVQQQPGFVLPRTRPGIGYGQFINKNHFSFLMEMAFGLVLGLGIGQGFRRDRVLVYVALLLPLWTGLVLCNSRGGVLAMLVQVVVGALLLASGVTGHYTRRIWSSGARARLLRIALLTALVIVVLVGTIWVGGDRLVTNFGEATNEFNVDTHSDRSGVSRNEIWKASWKMFAAHPILGVGLGGYWAAIPAYHDASGTTTPQQAHNDYLELLSSGGVVGFLICIWFAVALVRAMRLNLVAENRFQRTICFAATLGITGVAVHSLVDFGLHLLGNALVFIALVMCATVRIDEEK